MADAARPTHRPRARPPLTRVRTHNSQCNSFESWPKSLISLALHVVSSTSARPSTPDLSLAWCRSLAGRQPLGLGEDVGRVGGSAPRAQQLGGLQRHGTNYYCRAVAIRYMERKTGATSLRSCSITATWCSGFQWSLVLVLVPAGRPWAPAAYISSGSSWSSRELSRPARGGVLQSQKRTLLLLLLAGLVVVLLQGHAGRLWTAEPFVSAFARPRPGDRTKPRTRD